MLTRYGLWIAWGLSLWAVLQIGQFPWSMKGSICGPWGCGPPVPALIACHGGWIVILAPIASLISIRISPAHSRILGWTIITLGVAGIIGVGIYQSVTWLPNAAESVRHYFFRRWAFSVATLTDVPLLQTIAIGAFFVLFGREPVIEAVDMNEDIPDQA